MSKQGLFISFEGGEGAGKGTQVALLAERLRTLGRDILTVRDPGGTPESEKVRNLLVQRDGGDWTPKTEMLLYFAARVQMTEQLIFPNLDQGTWVLSDRYADSTRAYQAYGRGHELAIIEAINQAVLGDFEPDLTIILDIPVTTGLGRSKRGMQKSTDVRRQTEDRFERLATDFHERVRQGYLQIAREHPNRCHVIDANQDVDKVAQEVWKIVEQKVTAHG